MILEEKDSLAAGLSPSLLRLWRVLLEGKLTLSREVQDTCR